LRIIAKIGIFVAYPILAITFVVISRGVVIEEVATQMSFCVLIVPIWLLASVIGCLILLSFLLVVMFLEPIIHFFGKASEADSLTSPRKSLIKRTTIGFLISTTATSLAMIALGFMTVSDDPKLLVMSNFMCTVDMGFNFLGFMIALTRAFSWNPNDTASSKE